MPIVLAVSPHLDDAVFSAGGALCRYARKGWRVLVATVFTASTPNPSGFALDCQLDKGLAADVDYMALRRNEDAAACALIGAEPIWLPFVEAPHRGYSSAEALFAGLRSDDGVVETITPALGRLIASTNPDIVMAPQAIGAHADHIAVYAALSACPCAMELWTDFPYAARPASRPSPFAEAMRSLPRKAVDLDGNELRIKRGAAACYASQLGFQFGDARAARTAISASSAESYALRGSHGQK